MPRITMCASHTDAPTMSPDPVRIATAMLTARAIAANPEMSRCTSASRASGSPAPYFHTPARNTGIPISPAIATTFRMVGSCSDVYAVVITGTSSPTPVTASTARMRSTDDCAGGTCPPGITVRSQPSTPMPLRIIPSSSYGTLIRTCE